MADLYEQTKRLEGYFDQSIIEVERKALEEEASADPALAQQLRTQRETLMAFELLDREDKRKELLDLFVQVKADRKRKRRQVLRAGGLLTFAAAAVVAVIMLLPSFSFSIEDVNLGRETGIQAVPIVDREEMAASLEEEEDKIPKLVDEYFHPYEISMKYSQDKRINSLAQRLQVSYQNGHYEASVRGFKAILDADPKRSDAFLGLGISYLALDSLPLAAQALTKIIYLDKDYKEEAQWYLSLAYLKEGMVIQAIGLIEEIAREEGHFKQAEARAMLDAMR